MSNLSWCDLNYKGNLLKVHDMCPNCKCKCQNQIIFTPNQFQLEVPGFKNTMKKISSRCEKAWNSFLKPAVNT